MNLPIAEKILVEFDGLSPQMQTAARYILDNPSDVALLSMREQSRRAGVQPATMTRFAKLLGLEGFDELKVRYSDALRENQFGFSARARKIAASRELDDDTSADVAFVDQLGASVLGLGAQQVQANIAAAVDVLDAARRIYCIGVRSCLPAAWHFQYMIKLIGFDVVYLDGSGDTGLDPLANAGADDILVVFSLLPYSDRAVKVAGLCKARNIPVLAITDSQVSPVARIAKTTVVVPIESSGPFPSLGPLIVSVELIASLLSERRGSSALEHLEAMDQHQSDLATYFAASGKTGL